MCIKKGGKNEGGKWADMSVSLKKEENIKTKENADFWAAPSSSFSRPALFLLSVWGSAGPTTRPSGSSITLKHTNPSANGLGLMSPATNEQNERRRREEEQQRD